MITAQRLLRLASEFWLLSLLAHAVISCQRTPRWLADRVAQTRLANLRYGYIRPGRIGKPIRNDLDEHINSLLVAQGLRTACVDQSPQGLEQLPTCDSSRSRARVFHAAELRSARSPEILPKQSMHTRTRLANVTHFSTSGRISLRLASVVMMAPLTFGALCPNSEVSRLRKNRALTILRSSDLRWLGQRPSTFRVGGDA